MKSGRSGLRRHSIKVRRAALAGAALATALLGLIVVGALGAVSVGHSGWNWGSPQPQGNDLNGLDFAGGRGYASGAFGTLLRTDDAGQSWVGIATGLTQPLLRVRAIDANTVAIGGGCALRLSDDGGASFRRLPWTPSDQSCPSELASFSFPNTTTGYLLTEDGSVLRTDDGGQSFSRRTSVPGTISAGGGAHGADIFFTGPDTGVAIAGERIFRTTDGGNSWTQVSSGQSLNAVTFANANVGYAVGTVQIPMVGRRPTMLRTPNGGQTWTPVSLAGAGTGLDLTSLDCSGPQTCLVAESTGAQILRTTDGGATVTAISPSTQPIFAVAFDTPTQVVAVGKGGTIVVSTNGGLNFSPVGGRISGQGFGPVSTSAAGIATAGADNGILARSVDGGRTWTTIGVPTPARVVTASFPNVNVGYALDANGGVFKTANGGGSWTVLGTGTSARAKSVLALNPNVVLLLEPKGLRRSTNGGASFNRVADGDVKQTPLSIVGQISGQSVFAAGKKRLVVSGDGGKTWSNVPLPTKRFKLLDADMLSAKVGYASGTDRRLWKTTNGGRTWSGLPAVGAGFTGPISFSSEKRGFADGGVNVGGVSGYVLATKDGGQSWQPQVIAGNAVNVWDSGSVAFANTSGGSFFFTTTRGSAGIASKLKIKQVKKKAKTAKIAGTLRPANGGEQIFVSSRVAKTPVWTTRFITAASNGKFNATIGKVKSLTFVVAQWAGDGPRAGAGTKALRIQLPKTKHP